MTEQRHPIEEEIPPPDLRPSDAGDERDYYPEHPVEDEISQNPEDYPLPEEILDFTVEEDIFEDGIPHDA